MAFPVQNELLQGLSRLPAEEAGEMVRGQPQGIGDLMGLQGFCEMMVNVVRGMSQMKRKFWHILHFMHGQGKFRDGLPLDGGDFLHLLALVHPADEHVAHGVRLFRLQASLDAESGHHGDEDD